MSEGVGIDKPLLAFFNGLSKRLYFNEQDITDEFLRSEVLGGISDEGELQLETCRSAPFEVHNVLYKSLSC